MHSPGGLKADSIDVTTGRGRGARRSASRFLVLLFLPEQANNAAHGILLLLLLLGIVLLLIALLLLPAEGSENSLHPVSLLTAFASE